MSTQKTQLLDRDTLIYGGWIPHLCFNSEITISKNQLSSKSEQLKFRIINFGNNLKFFL